MNSEDIIRFFGTAQYVQFTKSSSAAFKHIIDLHFLKLKDHISASMPLISDCYRNALITF